MATPSAPVLRGRPPRADAERALATIDPGGTLGGPVTGNDGSFRWETYPERLERAGVGWRLYADAASRPASGLASFVQFQEAARPHPLWDAGARDRSIEDFEADCAANLLPWVSWVAVPEAPASAGGLGWIGQQAFVARAVAAVMGNPDLWKGSMIVLTHATSGGFFDHVAPPTPPDDALSEFVGPEPVGLGFRVPGLVLSPWSRGGVVHEARRVDVPAAERLQHLGVERRAAGGRLLAGCSGRRRRSRCKTTKVSTTILKSRLSCASRPTDLQFLFALVL